LVEAGRLREALAEADATISELTGSGSFLLFLASAEAAVAQALLETGSPDEARGFADRALAGLPHDSPLACHVAAYLTPVLVAAGRNEELATLLAQIDGVRMAAAQDSSQWLPAVVRGALTLGDATLAERLCEGFEQGSPSHDVALRTARAQILEARGELRSAADTFAAVEGGWESLGAGLERAYAALGHGRCLAALGDPAAGPALHDARHLFAEIGAAVRVADCDALLADVTRLEA
jgi:hypothetical protein